MKQSMKTITDDTSTRIRFGCHVLTIAETIKEALDEFQPRSLDFGYRPPNKICISYKGDQNYDQLIELATAIEHQLFLIFELENEAEIIELWEHPAFKHQPLLQLAAMPNGLGVGAEEKQYIIFDLSETLSGSVMAVLENSLVRAIGVKELFTCFKENHGEEGFVRQVVSAVKKYRLEVELKRVLPKLAKFKLEVEPVEQTHQALCTAVNYVHVLESWINPLQLLSDELKQLGFDMEGYLKRFGELDDLRNQKAKQHHADVVGNLAQYIQQELVDNYTKPQIIQLLDDQAFFYRPSWGKKKLAAAYELLPDKGMKFLELPTEPSLVGE